MLKRHLPRVIFRQTASPVERCEEELAARPHLPVLRHLQQVVLKWLREGRRGRGGEGKSEGARERGIEEWKEGVREAGMEEGREREEGMERGREPPNRSCQSSDTSNRSRSSGYLVTLCTLMEL